MHLFGRLHVGAVGVAARALLAPRPLRRIRANGRRGRRGAATLTVRQGRRVSKKHDAAVVRADRGKLCRNSNGQRRRRRRLALRFVARLVLELFGVVVNADQPLELGLEARLGVIRQVNGVNDQRSLVLIAVLRAEGGSGR